MSARENVQAFLDQRKTLSGIDQNVIHSVNGVPLAVSDLEHLVETAWMYEDLQR